MGEKFYTEEPVAPPTKVTSGKLTTTSALGNTPPAVTPGMPGDTTGFGGMANAPVKRTSHSFGHSVVQRLGNYRLSGHTGAHRIGKR